MTFQQLIEEIISLPGCFLVFDQKQERYGGPTEQAKGAFLNMFEEKEKADKALSVFRASKVNSLNLLEEARILLRNHSYARAITLAIMAYEELGKSQIAADYYSGILPECEYIKAFRKHEKTAYANRYAAIGHHEKVRHGYFVDSSVAKTLESIRQMALYADEDNDPSNNFSEEDAQTLINKVREHQGAIQHAEWLNGRIGSKALFK